MPFLVENLTSKYSSGNIAFSMTFYKYHKYMCVEESINSIKIVNSLQLTIILTVISTERLKVTELDHVHQMGLFHD